MDSICPLESGLCRAHAQPWGLPSRPALLIKRHLSAVCLQDSPPVSKQYWFLLVGLCRGSGTRTLSREGGIFLRHKVSQFCREINKASTSSHLSCGIKEKARWGARAAGKSLSLVTMLRRAGSPPSCLERLPQWLVRLNRAAGFPLYGLDAVLLFWASDAVVCHIYLGPQ